MGRGLSGAGAGPDLPILDARSPAAFAAGHAPGAAHLPEESWNARMAELPPRELVFHVVGEDESDSARLAALLAARGFAGARAAPPACLGDRRETGPARAWLWQPSEWLIACASALPLRGRALDVATGSGRNAVWLAARGLSVCGFDLLPDALVRARALADHAGALRARFVIADATAPLPFRAGQFDLVCGFRYLDRALFPRLVPLLAPGGQILWETFTREQANWGPPHRPEYLLESGELPRLCTAAGLVVEAARETVGPQGPALAAVRARRGARAFSLGTTARDE